MTSDSQKGGMKGATTWGNNEKEGKSSLSKLATRSGKRWFEKKMPTKILNIVVKTKEGFDRQRRKKTTMLEARPNSGPRSMPGGANRNMGGGKRHRVPGGH